MTHLESFWRAICPYRSYIWLFVMVHIFLFLLAVVGLIGSQPGSASFVLSIVNVALLSVSGGIAFTGFYVCTRREKEEF